MSWKGHLKRLKQEFDNLVSEPGQSGSRPPPVPPHPPVQALSSCEVYWKPRLFPDSPISHEWDAKLGNGPDGWGNQELQFYTAELHNAF